MDDSTDHDDHFSSKQSHLERLLFYSPKIGWQIDPFGHSSANADLVSRMGMEALFFARIDYQDRDIRQKNQAMEMIWRGSKSLGASSDLFTHVL